MIILEPQLKIKRYDPVQIMKNLEEACRTCYRSEDKITEDSYKNLLKNCINRGHESILEHEKVTIRMICDLGVYKDLTRHRHASFSIESTRYCNYSKDKFGNELKFIRPVNIEKDSVVFNEWCACMMYIERTYIELSGEGFNCKPDQLRMLLPHSIAAEVCMTANIREWKHILSLRANNRVHPAIQQLMIPLLLKFKEDMPEIFADIEYNTEFNPKDYAKVEIID